MTIQRFLPHILPLILIGCSSGSSNQNPGPEPAAALSAASFSFTGARVGTGSTAKVLTLTNTGSATLDLISVVISDPSQFPMTTTCAATLAAGANCSISVGFVPGSPGNLPAMLTIIDNAPGSPQTVAYTGTGTASAITLSSSGIAFTGTPFGTSSAAVGITLTNSGTATLNISGMTLGGSSPSAFTDTTTCGLTLAVDANCTISAIFSPTLMSPYSATLQLADDALNSPQSISLSGTVRAPAAYHAFGDSITYGFKLTNVDLAYPYLIATDYHTTVSNYGITGAMSCDIPAQEIFPNNDNPVAGSYPLYTVLIGTNDADGKGAGAYEAIFNYCQRSTLAWLGLPADLKILANSPGVTTKGGGSFVTTSNYNAWETTTLNACITFPITTTSTGPIYLWILMQDGGSGTLNFAVDGTVEGTFNTQASPAIQTNLKTKLAPALLRVPNVPAGQHLVTFTQTSSTGNMQILAVGAPPGRPRSLPTVVVGNIPLQQVFSSNQVSTCPTVAGLCAEYDADIRSNIAVFVNDGLDIRYADNSAYMHATASEMIDQWHPNPFGHTELQTAFEALLQ